MLNIKTDIDGIKIVSDVEGGSSTAKRSYNYRVSILLAVCFTL